MLATICARSMESNRGALFRSHIVVALGGNALLRRGEEMTMANQRKNVAEGIQSLIPVIQNNKVTIVHGNGPQVGLLLLESAAYEKATGLKAMEMDVLDAETEGMIGYLIEQAIPDLYDRGVVTVLSQIEVDESDPAFANPTKFIGPVYNKQEADKLGLPVKPDGDYYRRVVPSPMPVRLLPQEMRAIQLLTDNDHVVICAGGGGIPVIKNKLSGKYQGIEAVIDKDRAACMMGKALRADGLLILTDVPGVATDFGKPNEKWIQRVSPEQLKEMVQDFPDGSMRPKVESCIDFVQSTGGWAAVGSLTEAEAIVAGDAGTRIEPNLDAIQYHGNNMRVEPFIKTLKQ